MFRLSILNKTELHIDEDRTVLQYRQKPHINHVNLLESNKITPRVIIITFIFGPCESVKPLLIYPAASNNILAVIGIASIFNIVALIIVLLMVFVGIFGLRSFQMKIIQ